VFDSELGYRPRLGGETYSEQGVLRNDYDDAKRPGVERILFIGDSVTRRGSIVRALRELYGEQAYEYWNGGVESFNTIQEVRYYLRYNRSIQPDHVVLTFHNNDFETTPAVFEHEGRLVVYEPTRRLSEVNPWLLRHSRSYQTWLARPTRGGHGRIVEETAASLVELKRVLDSDSVRFTVLLLPLLAPVEEGMPGSPQ